MDMHTELKAVPHAGLGFHFLRVRVRTTEPRGLQEEIGPKSQDRRRRSSRHDDVRSGLPNVATCEVLGLASCHSEDSENGRYVWLIRPDIRMYCGRFVGPSLTAHGWSPCYKTKQMQKHPYDSKGDTHTWTYTPSLPPAFSLALSSLSRFSFRLVRWFWRHVSLPLGY